MLGLPFARVLCAQKPEISSFDLSLLDESTVPASLFFVREHYPAPATSAAGWKLKVRGAVEAPLEISYDQLLAEPQRVLPVTLECAENPVGGGLVSHAEWAGCSLAALLSKARVASGARSVRLSGADGFSRMIPISKASHADSLIVFTMNGERLTANHGFPMRAVIPGWYGMDSVKWLNDIQVLPDDETASQDYQQMTRALLGGSRNAGPVTAMQVKSTFSRPLDGAILSQRRFVVRGAAWAGEHRVRQVELSMDGGKSWATARLASTPLPYSWVGWSCEWKIPKAGEHRLTVRATDDAGRSQPETRQSDRVDGFELTPWQTIRITVL
jgi:DMSO/TMAO reductase YedYZ molybdopterin-dependent catalytic subunit